MDPVRRQSNGAPRSANAAKTSRTKGPSGFIIGCLATTHAQSPFMPTASTRPDRAVRFRPSPSQNGPIQPPVRARTRRGANSSSSSSSSSIADRRCARWRSARGVPAGGRGHLVQVRPSESARPPGVVKPGSRVAEDNPSQYAPERRPMRVVPLARVPELGHPSHTAAVCGLRV